MNATAVRYLEYMTHGFYNGLLSLADLEGFSDDELEAIYALGYNFFSFGMYEAARDVFTGLTIYAPDTPHYWRALGATNQQMRRYGEAVAAYNEAIALDQLDVISRAYRGESYLLSGNPEAAISDFNRVIEISDTYEHPDHQPWASRSRLLLSRHANDR